MGKGVRFAYGKKRKKKNKDLKEKGGGKIGQSPICCDYSVTSTSFSVDSQIPCLVQYA
jgi:hypothetical protein